MSRFQCSQFIPFLSAVAAFGLAMAALAAEKPADDQKTDGQCPLYKHLTSKETNGKFAGPITWNFEKFLIGRNGEVVARFAPRVKPDAKEVVSAIEAELARK